MDAGERRTGEDQPVLADLAATLRTQDPRFAQGLRVGHPVAPREYRERSARVVTMALAAGQVAMLVVGWNGWVVAIGIVTLGWAARRP